MSTHLAKLFIEDNRAVAPIIGFILLFGILTVAFAGYQAEYVPQQNAETEFQHYQDVRNDLIVVRNAISRAGQQNQSQFESVRLGTQYRERTLALNPPDPAGTLRTSENHTITLYNGTTTTNVTTRFIKYRNGYNELDINPIYYENSVLYLDAERGQRVFFEDQNLVRENGSTVVITALQREFSRSATGRVTLELYPTDGGDPLPTGDVNVTLPTQLPNSYWDGELKGEDAINGSSYNYTNRTNKVNQVSFNVSSEDLELNTVGINDEPDQEGAVSDIGDNDRDGTTPGFSKVNAENLPKNEAKSPQILSFTLSDEPLATTEDVTIDLENPQSGDIDYGSSGVNDSDATFTEQDTNTAVIKYDPDQEISVGEQIELEVSDVDYPQGNLEDYTVNFARSDGDSKSTTFSDD